MIEDASTTPTPVQDSEIVVIRDGQKVSEPEPQSLQVDSYILEDDGIYMVVPGDDGEQGKVRLTNFTARILNDITRTDGGDGEGTFCEVETVLKGERKTFTIPAGRFDGLGWVPEQLGARAVIEPVAGAKNHVKTAIKKFSQDCGKRTVFCCTGWTLHEGQWVFLNAGEPISAKPLSSMPESELPRELSRYELTLPADREEACQATQASLKLLDLAEDRITVPVLAAIYRAVLGQCDFALHLSGTTGMFKSSLAALAQQHFGSEMDITNLPASWSSTPNALENLGFAAKDVVMVVDDYVPSEPGTRQAAERVFRAQGNCLGRSRLSGGGTKAQSGRYPRGLILSTGEDVPGGQSLRARMVVTEIDTNSISQERLTLCQADASSGLYVKAMAGYVRWLASRYDKIDRNKEVEIANLRSTFEAHGKHRRAATAVANLMWGLDHLLDYAAETGAISPAEQSQLRERFVTALKVVAAEQEQQSVQNEARKFIHLLCSAFASGQAHLRSVRCGSQPWNSVRWGWSSPVGKSQMVPKGRLVGWIDEEEKEEKFLMLLPDVSYSVAQAAAPTPQDRIKIGPRALWKRLEEEGVLVATEADIKRGRTVRMCIRGTRRTVLNLLVERFLRVEDEDPEPSPASPNGPATDTMSAATKSQAAKQSVFVDGSCAPEGSRGREYVRSPEENKDLGEWNIILLNENGTYTVLERSQGPTERDPKGFRFANQYLKLAGDERYNGKVRLMSWIGKRLTGVPVPSLFG